jgi:hypothetical protein
MCHFHMFLDYLMMLYDYAGRMIMYVLLVELGNQR